MTKYPLGSQGFLPKEDPLTVLPDPWKHIDDLGNAVPQLLRTRTLQHELDRVKPFSLRGLTKPEQELMMVRLSFLASAYVFAKGDPENPTNHIPKGIAKPFVRLAKIMGRPPILSYASYCLNNWWRPKPDEPLSLTNVALIQNFLATDDENWFIWIHIVIEKQASIALQYIPLAQQAVTEGNEQALLVHLQKIFYSLVAIHDTLKKMREGCSPEKYWHEVRPYIFGFTNVVYQGVSDKPHSYRGETGAQSSIAPSLVAAFRIGHNPTELVDHLSQMQNYMPPAHRNFIRTIWDGPSIPAFILASAKRQEELKSIFNRCLGKLVDFRSVHFALAHDYITKKVSNPLGTGGTVFEKFLAQMRDETERRKLC